MDLLLATGEQAATALVAMAVNALGGRAISLTGAHAGILTDRVHTKAKIANISPKQIHELLSDDYIVIVAGFQGQTPEGETTTLGRGGSDLTAIALAGALERGRLPDFHGCRWRLHLRSAHRRRGGEAGGDRLRRAPRDGRRRREGDAIPRGRVRQEIQRALRSALQFQPQSRHGRQRGNREHGRHRHPRRQHRAEAGQVDPR